MATKEIKFSFEARDRMLRGIDILASAVRVTLGPRGRNVAIDRSFGAKITKDGVGVANEIELGDKFENMGVQLVRQVATKTSYQAGDGTTTAVVLAHAIVVNGAKAVAAGMNPMDLKRGIDRAVKAVLAEFKKNARKVTSNVEIAQIATISGNGDTEIGRHIAEAMQKVGNNGVITIEVGTSLETELEVVEGIQFDRSYISPHFITNRMKRLVEMEDAYILLSEKKLASLNELLPLLEKVVQAAKPLLIIAEDVEGEVMAALVVNKLRGSLKVAAVKAPAYGDLRKAILQDIAILTGGTVISEDLGLKLENLPLDIARTHQEGDDRQAEHHDRRRGRQAGGYRRPHCRDQGPARSGHLRLRSREASGAAGQAQRWHRRDADRRRYRNGGRGEEGSHPQRDACHASGSRGGHLAGWRRRVAARQHGRGKSQDR